MSRAIAVSSRRWRTAVAVAVVGAVVVSTIALQATPSQGHPDDVPLPTIAVLARSDNPVDALAASTTAARLGGILVLTPSDSLHPEASAALAAHAPDLVILAGGEQALGPQVVQAVEEEGYTTFRAGGQTREATARLLAQIPAQYGLGKPLVVGGRVQGSADIAGPFFADTVHAGQLTVRDRNVVFDLNADAVDGLHATDLVSPPLQMHTLGDLRPVTDDRGVPTPEVTVIETAEGRRIQADEAGTYTLVGDLESPYRVSGSIPLFGRLVRVELCYAVADVDDRVGRASAFVLGTEFAAGEQIDLDQDTPVCEDLEIPPTDVDGPVRVALEWSPAAGGPEHALNVYGLRSTWDRQ